MRQTYEQLSDQLLMYLNNETDFRGQVPSYGWAHSIAHIADVYQVWLAHPRCRVAEQQAGNRPLYRNFDNA